MTRMVKITFCCCCCCGGGGVCGVWGGVWGWVWGGCVCVGGVWGCVCVCVFCVLCFVLFVFYCSFFSKVHIKLLKIRPTIIMVSSNDFKAFYDFQLKI